MLSWVLMRRSENLLSWNFEDCLSSFSRNDWEASQLKHGMGVTHSREEEKGELSFYLTKGPARNCVAILAARHVQTFAHGSEKHEQDGKGPWKDKHLVSVRHTQKITRLGGKRSKNIVTIINSLFTFGQEGNLRYRRRRRRREEREWSKKNTLGTWNDILKRFY